MMPGWAPGGGTLSRFGDAVTAVVTGGNRGLGLAFCRQLLRVPRVTRIHATCRSPETAEDLAALSESEPSRLRILPMDVTKESSIAQMAARVGDDGRPVNLVINVAGSTASLFRRWRRPRAGATPGRYRSSMAGGVLPGECFRPPARGETSSATAPQARARGVCIHFGPGRQHRRQSPWRLVCLPGVQGGAKHVYAGPRDRTAAPRGRDRLRRSCIREPRTPVCRGRSRRACRPTSCSRRTRPPGTCWR